MKFITFSKKQSALGLAVGVLLSFTSCGSFQYSGIYDDGIYSETKPAEDVRETVENTTSSSEYYKNYFKEKSLQIEEDNTVFTDVDSYGGAYEDDSENTNNYASWGENNSSETIINIYNNDPYYGNGWGYNYRNNWGWNLGWNSWGFGFWQPNYYNPWFNPYCNFNCYNNYGYGYYNYGYNGYRGRSYAYINGTRNGRFRNSTLTGRSVLSATTRNRANTRSNTRSSTRTRATSRPTNRISTTRSRTISRPTNTRSTRSNSTPRPTRTRSSNSTSRPNTTTRPNRSTTRSSTPSSTRTRSTSTSRSSRSSGSSTRRRNN